MVAPSILFDQPMCCEVMGAGFQKLPWGEASFTSRERCPASTCNHKLTFSCTNYDGLGCKRSLRSGSADGVTVSIAQCQPLYAREAAADDQRWMVQPSYKQLIKLWGTTKHPIQPHLPKTTRSEHFGVAHHHAPSTLSIGLPLYLHHDALLSISATCPLPIWLIWQSLPNRPLLLHPLVVRLDIG